MAYKDSPNKQLMGNFPKPFGKSKVKKSAKQNFHKLAGLDVAKEEMITQSGQNLIDGFKTGPKQFGEAIFEAAVTAPPASPTTPPINPPNKQLAAGIGALASTINPITGMPASANMGNMPPQPSNTMGNANPVFNNPAMAAAQGVFGSTQMRQNSVTPFQQKQLGVDYYYKSTKPGDLLDETTHEETMYKSNNLKKKIPGSKYNVENISQVQEDEKGQFVTTLDQDEFYGGPRPTGSTVSNYDQGNNAIRDTLRPYSGKKFFNPKNIK